MSLTPQLPNISVILLSYPSPLPFIMQNLCLRKTVVVFLIHRANCNLNEIVLCFQFYKGIPIIEHNRMGREGYVIMHPPWGPKGLCVAERQHGGCTSIFAGVFSLNLNSTHTKGY